MKVVGILAVAAILAATVPAHAEKKLPTDAAIDNCNVRGRVAERVMEARQDGKTVTSVMGTIQGVLAELKKQYAKERGTPYAFVPLVEENGYKDMVYSAYEVPRYSWAWEKSTAVKDFREQMEIKCLKEMIEYYRKN